MKLYREVLIEPAEQAEALPIGTLAAPMYEDGPDFVYALVRREETYEPWCNSDGSHARGHGDLDGFVALVPIEAEEEWIDNGNFVVNIGEGDATPADVDDYERRNGSRPSRRLVTPWEDA